MNDILVVPDVHGRRFWEAALDYQGEVIFLGDYTDPYPGEGITEADAYETLTRIVDFKKKYPDRVTLLAGNHELHYYDTEYRCSRFSLKFYSQIHEIVAGETKDLFQLCKQLDKYLFIHAGILSGWYRKHAGKFADLGDTLEEKLNRFFDINKDAFYEVSYLYRGGYHKDGSPLWADIHEHLSEKEPFDSQLVQVIGHTQITSEKPMIWKHIRLLDNSKLYLLKEDALTIYE